MKRYIIALLAMLCLSGAALAQSPPQPIRVVATFTILADFVREVGGERVQVASLVPADGDAHAWQPSPADGRTVAAAQLVVRNGLGFEGRGFERLFRSAGYRGPIVEASQGSALRERERRAHAHDHGGANSDPHAWQSVRNAQVYVRNIAEGLARLDAAGAASYRANAERYAQRLAELDTWVRAQIDAVPQERRRVITNHDAFSYFAAEYGVTFVAAQGVSTEGAVSAAAVARVIAQARQLAIRAIFLENMGNPRLIEQIAREIGAPIGGRLYADALSRPGGPAPSYEAMMRHNAQALAAAMQRN